MHLAESEELEQPEFQYSFNSSQFHSIGRFEKKWRLLRQNLVSSYTLHTTLCTFRPFLPAPDAAV